MVKATSTNLQKPLLYFFQLPEDKVKSEGVASALQSFETAVMLVGYGRWPSIIPLIWSACEALLRVNYPQFDKNTDVWIIQDEFYKDGKVSRALNDSAHKLRKLRNDINHEGYMPRDTPRCVELFFNAGIPYLDHLLNDVTGYGLFDELYPKNGIWDVFRNTRKAVTKKRNKSNGAIEDALFFLTLKVRETFSPTFVPEALWDMQESEQDALWRSEMKTRNRLIETIIKEGSDNCPEFTGVACPVCDNDVFGSVHWKDKGNDYKFEGIKSVGCYKCDYLLNDADMIKIFFQGQLTKDNITKLESGDAPLAEIVFL